MIENLINMSYNPIMDTTMETMKLIEKTLDCNFRGQWEINPPASHFYGWSSFPTPMISLMLRGKVQMSIKGKQEQTIYWNEGEVACLLPSMSRLIRVISPENIHYCGVAVSFNVLHGFDPLSFFDLPVVQTKTNSKHLGQILKKIIATGSIDNPLKKVIARKALCTKLLHQLLEPVNMMPDMQQRLCDLGRLTAAVNHLIKNYTDKLDIAYLARLSFLSKSRFHVVFKNTIGCTPYEFVKSRRLDKALSMLASDKYTIAEIGQALGWNDQFHFSRTFKRFFGVSPLHYRKNNFQMDES